MKIIVFDFFVFPGRRHKITSRFNFSSYLEAVGKFPFRYNFRYYGNTVKDPLTKRDNKGVIGRFKNKARNEEKLA